MYVFCKNMLNLKYEYVLYIHMYTIVLYIVDRAGVPPCWGRILLKPDDRTSARRKCPANNVTHVKPKWEFPKIWQYKLFGGFLK